MPSITRDQRAYCKIAQLNNAMYAGMPKESKFDIINEIDDVNFKILSNKSSRNYLIGATPLHIVCYYRNVEALDVLLSRGVDITAKNRNGRTALHHLFYYMNPTDVENALIRSLLKAHVESANIKNPRSPDGLNHFHVACAVNHLDAIELFLNGGVSVNEETNVGSFKYPEYTPLHFATRFGSIATVKLLLERGADINAKDAKGLTPLALIVNRNSQLIGYKNDEYCTNPDKWSKYIMENEKVIKLFLEDERVTNIDEIGFGKFHAACTLSDCLMVERFIEKIDVNSAIHMDSPIFPGYTGLHFAAHFDRNIVKLLLKNGGDIAAEDVNGVTPFDICLKVHGLENLYDILSAIPAYEEVTFSDNQTKLSDFFIAMRTRTTAEKFFQSTAPTDMYLPMNCPLWTGYCLSHLAVLLSSDYPASIISKDERICHAEIYLECGGTTVLQDARGRSPLHLAFYQQKRRIISLFFNRQLGLVDSVDDNGLSHLHVACTPGRDGSAAMRILLSSSGANVNAVYKGKTLITSRIKSGSTPLHVAVALENPLVINLLLEHGADKNATDAEGMTPIHRLIEMKSFTKHFKDVADLLLTPFEHLTNVICSETGLSYLHVASYAGNADATERLLGLGADVNAVFRIENHPQSHDVSLSSYKGYTPLHFAAETRDIKVIEVLLRSGADILRRTRSDKTIFYEILRLRSPSYLLDSGEIDAKNAEITRAFASRLSNDVALQRKLREDSGMTLLHLACLFRNADQIQSLLADTMVDVNAQIQANSPIWPKATPLHLLISSRYEDTNVLDNLKYQVQLLLDRGANVTLANYEGDTPLHVGWKYQLTVGTFENVDRDNELGLLRLMFEYQTDFSLNPVDEQGVSHFHMACMLGEYTIVEKFLKSGIDVNLPVDYLDQSMTFKTPLQFMLRLRRLPIMRYLRLANADSLLKTIDVLFKYGADVDVRDENGSNSLLEVAGIRETRMLLLQKLHKAGADINCRDFQCRSALEILFNSHGMVTVEEIQIFLDNPSNHFNFFNPSTKIGIISKFIERVHQKLILQSVMKCPSLFSIDEMGRTPIHNLVSNRNTCISPIEYAVYIEKFIEMGYDIDAQDSEGKTALDSAVSFSNEKAFCGLLIAGADINVARTSAPMKPQNSYSIGRDQRLKNIIACHTIAMQLCGLEINAEIFKYANDGLSESEMHLQRQAILKELEDAKQVKIGVGSLILRDFLSETGAVASRPSMMCCDREAVDEFFETIHNQRFPTLSGLFKLQYRKMLNRLTLIEDATDAVREILGCINGFSMPEICCRMILRFLTNTDIKRLIISMSTNDTYLENK